MQRMAKDVRELLPYLYDKEAFHAVKNHEKIEASLKNFSEHVHKITPKMGESVLGDDPLISFSLENLEGDLKRSYQAFELDHLEYSRTVAKSSINNCFRCHSVTTASSNAQWDLQNVSQLQLNPVEKADLLVATRKYDLALQHMEQILSSQEYVTNHPFDFESILRRYLALVTRIQKDPARALNEIDRISAYPELPHYLHEQVRGWRISLINWIHEDKTIAKTEGKGKSKKQKRKHKEAPPLEQAKKEMDRAGQLQQFPQDHAGDVEYLRATVSLHESLKKNLKPQDEAEAYYLLGRAYEVLDELGSWNLHEAYFEACVKKAPHTGWSKMCYARYEESVLQGYSGSSGTHIPAYEAEKLKSLKELL
jgi:hypothetical protein